MTEFEEKMLALKAREVDALEAISAALKGGARPAPGPTATGGQRNSAPAPAPAPAPTIFPNYGRHKGEPIAGADDDTLDYYENGARRTLDDASKSYFHAKEEALIAAIEAERNGRGGGRGGGTDDWRGPPPQDSGGPSDEDIPF